MRNRQDPFYFAPQRKLGGGWICWKDSPSPPPAPDYAGAAQATSQGSVQAAITNALLNHVNTNTPLGSQTWSANGTQSIPAIGGQPGFDIPNYSQSISMTPEGQRLYQGQLGLSQGLLDTSNQSLGQTQKSLGTPSDLSSVQDVSDRAYAQQTARLDPQWKQAEGANDAALANQGIMQGSEAYNNAKRVLGQQKDDAYNQARVSADATMPQTYQLSAAERMQPLVELNALRTGAQPQMPQFQATPAAGGAQGPNLLAAEQSQGQYDQGLYNTGVASSNSQTAGLMSMAAAAAAMI